MTDVLTILHYKLFSSLMAHFFRYPADEKTATATYAAQKNTPLNKKARGVV
jgi:hypothetical protein